MDISQKNGTNIALFVVAGILFLFGLIMFTNNHTMSDFFYKLPKQKPLSGDGAWHVLEFVEATDRWYAEGRPSGFGGTPGYAGYIAGLTNLKIDSNESWQETKAVILDTAQSGSQNVSTISYVLLILGSFLFLFGLFSLFSPNRGTHNNSASLGEPISVPQCTSTSGQQVNGSTADEIKKFSELKDSGVITEQEFQKKKDELLNRSETPED